MLCRFVELWSVGLVVFCRWICLKKVWCFGAQAVGFEYGVVLRLSSKKKMMESQRVSSYRIIRGKLIILS